MTCQGHAEEAGRGINAASLLEHDSALPIKEITINCCVFVCCEMTTEVLLQGYVSLNLSQLLFHR